MAHALSFDTLHFANKLKAVGIPAKQAETQAETIAEIFDETEKHIALKQDVDKVMTSLNSEIQISHHETLRVLDNIRNENAIEFQRVRSEANDIYVELSKKIQDVRSELKTEIQELRTELKAEIQEVRAELKAEIQEVRAELKAEMQELRADMEIKFAKVYQAIAEVKNEMIKWVIGIAFGQTALMFTFLKIFIHSN